MSTGGGTSTTITEANVPKWIEAATKDGLTAGKRDWEAGALSPYGGDTYAGLNATQRDALGSISYLGNRGGPQFVKEGLGSARDILGGGQVGDAYANLSQFDPRAGMNGFNAVTAQGGRFDGQQMAGGAYDPMQAMMADPATRDGFNESVQAAAHPELMAAKSAFESAGRTGSGLAEEAKTDAIARAFAGQWGAERGRLGSMYGQERGLQGGLADSERARRAGLYAGDRAQRAGLYGQDRGIEANLMNSDAARQAAMIGQLPGLEGLGYSPYERQLGVGDRRQQDTQGAYDDKMRQFHYNQGLEDQNVDDYVRRLSGLIPGATYQGSNVIEPTTGNPLLSGLGGAAQGFGMFGVPGAIGGGLLGALGGMNF